jgi:hypothetical protein
LSAGLSGRWTVTAVSGDGTDAGWLEFTEPSMSFGFAAGYAYGAACVAWVTNGLSAPAPISQCSYPPTPPDPVTGAVLDPFMLRAVLEHPTEVTEDAETLTVFGRSPGGGWSLGIRARGDGDAEPQVVPKEWVSDAVWAIRAAGDVAPETAEDLAWIRLSGSTADGTGMRLVEVLDAELRARLAGGDPTGAIDDDTIGDGCGWTDQRSGVHCRPAWP